MLILRGHLFLESSIHVYHLMWLLIIWIQETVNIFYTCLYYIIYFMLLWTCTRKNFTSCYYKSSLWALIGTYEISKLYISQLQSMLPVVNYWLQTYRYWMVGGIMLLLISEASYWRERIIRVSFGHNLLHWWP